MKVSPAVRALRAAVFAALCVLLGAGAHALATGSAPPVWVQVAGVVPIFLAGCLLGGRERSPAGIGGGTFTAQGCLHLAFGAARPHTATMVMHGMRMPHPHALTPHATAVHMAATLLLTWWLRCGESAVWSLLRRAVVNAFARGLAAWWRVRQGEWAWPNAVAFGRLGTGAPRPPRQVLLRHSVHRRGPPLGIPYAI